MGMVIKEKPFIHQFAGESFDANSYVITEKNEALIIDAVDSSEMVSFLLEQNLTVLTILLTHEHFDHISGLEGLRDNFRCYVVSSSNCSRRVQSPQTNLSSIGNVVYSMYNKKAPVKRIPMFAAAASDEEFTEDISFIWNHHTVFCHPMCGHSSGSAGYILDERILFSGDELLPLPTATRLPGGDSRAFWYEDMPWMGSVKDQISLVCPGHGMPGELDTMLNGNVIPEKYRDMGNKKNAQAGIL